MITRRDALRIAAGLAAATAATPPIARAEAAELLAQPLDAGDPLTLPSGTPIIANPSAFADEMHGHHPFDNRDNSLFDYIAPAQRAAYERTLAAVYESMPFLRDLPFDHPFTRLVDGITLEWAMAAYTKGLADGAAYEHLRLALTGPTRVCVACEGCGLLGENDRAALHKVPARPCPDCGGTGLRSNA